MSDMLNIGRSGLTVARAALTVTGENIANAQTEGYRKRSVSSIELTSGGATPTTLAARPQGVILSDIRRAFDALVADRGYQASANLASAQATAPHLAELEARLQAGGAGPVAALNEFFDALGGLAGAPSDGGLRRVVLEQGRALASSVADMGSALAGLDAGIAAETTQAYRRANSLMTELAKTQADLARQPMGSGQNPLLDQRDRLIGSLAEVMDISVSYDQFNIAQIRFGGAGGGPLLVDGAQAGRIEPASAGRVAIFPAGSQTTTPVIRAPSGGQIAGLWAAALSVAETRQGFDQWAANLARDMNAVHGGGIDQMGRSGGDLFALEGWRADQGPNNRGGATAIVTITDPVILLGGPLEILRDGPAGEWVLRDALGQELDRSQTRLQAQGMVIDLQGMGADGDRITLTRTTGQAVNMRFLPLKGDAIAAAAPLVVSAAPDNIGTARLNLRASPPAPPALENLATALSDGAVSFLSDGVVGYVPAGQGGLDLQSLPQLAALELAPAAGARISQLTLGAHQFTIAPPRLPVDLIAGLQSGVLVSDLGARLSDLGLQAALVADRLRISADVGSTLPSADAMTDEGAIAGLVVSTEIPPSSLRLFTRDGRQIYGPPLDPAMAASVVTPANGFDAGAVFDATGLPASPDPTRITLSPLPQGEDLIVMMEGGAVRLGGAIAPLRPEDLPAQEIRVLDAATGQIGLFDTATDTLVAQTTLDAGGVGRLAGFDVTLSRGYATGDRFALTPAQAQSGDATQIEALADLARPVAGQSVGGFAARFADLQSQVGAAVNAADIRRDSAMAQKDAALRAEAAISAVDLDTEAANLMAQQQAYQANAQVISVARGIFDRLLELI